MCILKTTNPDAAVAVTDGQFHCGSIVGDSLVLTAMQASPAMARMFILNVPSPEAAVA